MQTHTRWMLTGALLTAMASVAQADLQLDVGGGSGVYAGTNAPAQADGLSPQGSWVEVSENLNGTGSGTPPVLFVADSNAVTIEVDFARPAGALTQQVYLGGSWLAWGWLSRWSCGGQAHAD